MATTATRPTNFPSRDPQAYTTPPNSQGAHPQYGLLYQQRYSPSTTASHTSSPNSPASPHQNAPNPEFPSLPLATRQLRAPQSPMYIPAALRPTDRPPRSQPLTPPRSLHGSTDSLDKKGKISRPSSRRSTTASSLNQISKPSLLAHIPHEDLEAAEENTSDLPEITGPPTRTHWKPDANALICDYPICQKSFGLFERRHHCRVCGNVFCNEHSNDKVPIDQNADFHPKGRVERCCEHDAKEWVLWVEERIRRMKGGDNEAEDTEPMALTGRAGNADAHKASIVAGSVTNEWSTF
ncbi:MAG: hypothetical protein Q9164_006364 [Protoblastenia rupestris]